MADASRKSTRADMKEHQLRTRHLTPDEVAKLNAARNLPRGGIPRRRRPTIHWAWLSVFGAVAFVIATLWVFR